MKDKYRFSVILRLISAILLLLAIGSHPSSYFQILRWVVSGASFYSGWVSSKLKKSSWAWIFFIVGILFNPIVPVYLNRSTWQIIDIITAIILFISLSIKNNKHEKSV